jgi:hypothetical protein
MDDYCFTLIFGKLYKERYIKIDLPKLAKAYFGLSTSEVKRLLDQGGVKLYMPKGVKIVEQSDDRN